MIICEFSENMQNSKMLKKMLNFKDVWFATDLIASREYSLDIHVKINTTRLLVIYAFFFSIF